MSWVYSIAFLGDRFVMVYNPTRKGWEMPGGRIEKGETDEQAAIREFKEESGCNFRPSASIPHRDGMVFTGDLDCPVKKAEMEWDLFVNLPEKLGFPEEEYGPLIEWAKQEKKKRGEPTRFNSCIS